MAISDLASDHFQSARLFGEHLYPMASEPLWKGQKYQHDRIRIAYVSPDLREHPVGHLITGVIEHHDQGRFELFAVSLGADDKSRIRQRLAASFEHFVDARSMNSNDIARFMQQQEIDIAIDLGGYTSDCRPEIFAQRPAPVQVSFLGYAGSMAMPYIDYIIADERVAPPEHWPQYSERLVFLPNAYMPVDDSLDIPPPQSRAAYGLPEKGLVFCAFCHDFKINPPVFAIWMKCLQATPHSVLWLMSRNETSRRNLQTAAAGYGVSPERLIFASRVPRVEDHLARYRVADLFLDTFPYNAHTTAADALLAGLPVLTCMGRGFHARVAGSLAENAGLPELVTHSLQQYEAVLLALAEQPERLRIARQLLAARRQTAPLFQTRRFCRDLESAYIAMWRRAQLAMPDQL